MSRTVAPILFVTREPVTRERNGSTTAVANLLQLLRAHGAPVTVLVTTAASRSPRLFFRNSTPLPAGCDLRVPGYLRLGSVFLRPWAPLALARFAARILRRTGRFARLERALTVLCRGRLFTNSWDLTEPTAGEHTLVHRELQRLQPATVLANYAFWGPPLHAIPRVHRAILMHDRLADHVRLFHQSGLPLDCNPITPQLETDWLNGADTLIAVQRAEADTVRTLVRGVVLVQPIALPVRPASAHPEPHHCLLVASNSTPNLQGLRWLVDQVWPHVVACCPTATLAVAGTVRDRWTGPVPAGISLLGPVPSLAAEHDRAAVCLVPLLVGSGIKIKLLEALSHGKATVSTSIGIQGLEDWAPNTISVADDPREFANAVVHLLRHARLRQQREYAASALVRTHFSAGSPAEQALLDRLLQPATAHFSGIGHMAPPAKHNAFNPRGIPVAPTVRSYISP